LFAVLTQAGRAAQTVSTHDGTGEKICQYCIHAGLPGNHKNARRFLTDSAWSKKFHGNHKECIGFHANQAYRGLRDTAALTSLWMSCASSDWACCGLLAVKSCGVCFAPKNELDGIFPIYQLLIRYANGLSTALFTGNVYNFCLFFRQMLMSDAGGRSKAASCIGTRGLSMEMRQKQCGRRSQGWTGELLHQGA
jgi:hypothetical protein